ncbi:MAG: alpha/beta hydrolase [Chlamydiia bacterium]|nr:alpha/beta hydrolase [Chlamydiia bacterium]
MLNFYKILLSLVILLPLNATLKESDGHYVKINKNVSLFYYDKGSGDPLIFIPGWLMPADIFKHQIAHFSQKYRVIALDPRSQGNSTVTLENNHYTQHGADLAKFLDALHLQNVIVVAWSWGCNDLYAYVRLKGTDNLKAAICIDASPKSSGGKEEWAFANYQDWGSSVAQPMMYHRPSYAKQWIRQFMIFDEMM